MRWLLIPLPQIRWRPLRFIVGGMRKSPGLIQPRETQTLHVTTFEWYMNHLNDWSHRWHSASVSRKDHFLLCSNSILQLNINGFYLPISNTVSNRDPDNGSLAIDQEQVYMPHKDLWGKIKVPFMCNQCLDDQYRSSSFNIERLKLSIGFTRQTSMANDKWNWKMDHWLISSTSHSLPSPQQASTIVFQPGNRLV